MIMTPHATILQGDWKHDDVLSDQALSRFGAECAGVLIVSLSRENGLRPALRVSRLS